MAFWGLQLKPNVKTPVQLPQTEILHLSQLCLHDPKDGKNLVQVTVKGATYTIACLEKNKHEHDSVDLFFGPDTCSFTNKGNSEVHLLGYLEPEQDDVESEEEKGAGAPKLAAIASPKVAAASPKVAAASPKLAAAVPVAAVPAKVSPKLSPKEARAAPAKAAPAKGAPESDDDGFLEEGEEEELMGDEEEESEEEKPQTKAKGGNKPAVVAAPATSPKRKAQEPAASPAKKPKADGPAATYGASSDEVAYVTLLVDYLKKNGKTPSSILGGMVKKPEGVSKMKNVLAKHTDKFLVAVGEVTAK